MTTATANRKANAHHSVHSQIHGITNAQLTTDALLRSAQRVAAALDALGIGAGDHVAVCSENRLEIAVAMFGTLLHGATLVPMNPTYTARELHHAFHLTRPRVVFVSADAQTAVEEVAAGSAFVQTVVALDVAATTVGTRRTAKTISWQAFVADASASNAEQPRSRPQQMAEKVALILFSSGTTGLPKGVELTERNILTSIAQHE